MLLPIVLSIGGFYDLIRLRQIWFCGVLEETWVKISFMVGMDENWLAHLLLYFRDLLGLLPTRFAYKFEQKNSGVEKEIPNRFFQIGEKMSPGGENCFGWSFAGTATG
jgi:hypothetical protein